MLIDPTSTSQMEYSYFCLFIFNSWNKYVNDQCLTL